MIKFPRAETNLESVRKLEDLPGYEFSSSFKIFEETPHSRFFLHQFPKITDVKLPKLEVELNKVSRFIFSDGLVGFFEVGYENDQNVKFFESRSYDFFSRGFVGERFYKKNGEYLDENGILTKNIRSDSPEGILPSIYLLKSDNELGRIFMKNYIIKNDSEKEKYEKGIKFKIAISASRDGEEILKSLKNKMLSLYGKEYQRVDLNN